MPTPDPIRALSVRQPWAWAIAHGGKDIENRSWANSQYRGLLAIHASSRWDGADALNTVSTLSGRPISDIRITGKETSAIVAVADFEKLHGSHACHRDHPLLARVHPDGPYECSRWALGGATGHGPMVHWELSNVRPLAEPVPCKGRLGLWTLPADVDAVVRAQLDAQAVAHAR